MHSCLLLGFTRGINMSKDYKQTGFTAGNATEKGSAFHGKLTSGYVLFIRKPPQTKSKINSHPSLTWRMRLHLSFKTKAETDDGYQTDPLDNNLL